MVCARFCVSEVIPWNLANYVAKPWAETVHSATQSNPYQPGEHVIIRELFWVGEFHKYLQSVNNQMNTQLFLSRTASLYHRMQFMPRKWSPRYYGTKHILFNSLFVCRIHSHGGMFTAPELCHRDVTSGTLTHWITFVHFSKLQFKCECGLTRGVSADYILPVKALRSVFYYHIPLTPNYISYSSSIPVIECGR